MRFKFKYLGEFEVDFEKRVKDIKQGPSRGLLIKKKNKVNNFVRLSL